MKRLSDKEDVMEETKPGYRSIDEYIAAFPDSIQAILQELRSVIHSAAPEATEKISYQIPTFYLKGNLVHFAAFKNHIGFYPGSSPIEAFSQELAFFKTSKGTVQFPIDKPMPYDLVRKIVLFRVEENLKTNHNR